MELNNNSPTSINSVSSTNTNNFSNVNGVDTSNINLVNNTPVSTEYFDSRIKDLTNQYNDLVLKTSDAWYYNNIKKRQAEITSEPWYKKKIALLGLLTGPFGASVFAADQARKIHSEEKRHYDSNINLKNNIYTQLQDVLAKRSEFLTNIQSQKDRYKLELSALKSAGITNPYYALKGGPLSSGPSVSLSGGGKFSGFQGENEDLLERLLKYLLILSKISKNTVASVGDIA